MMIAAHYAISCEVSKRFSSQSLDAGLSKEDCIKELARSSYRREQTVLLPKLPLHALEIRLLDWDIAQVTYKSKVTYDGVAEHGRRSSLWSRSAGTWVLRFHQGTPYVP
jgi:hypothetical protein